MENDLIKFSTPTSRGEAIQEIRTIEKERSIIAIFPKSPIATQGTNLIPKLIEITSMVIRVFKLLLGSLITNSMVKLLITILKMIKDRNLLLTLSLSPLLLD